jgi:hypothetical protein
MADGLGFHDIAVQRISEEEERNMKPFRYSRIGVTGLFAAVLLASVVGIAAATPVIPDNPSGVVFNTRVFNDCPGSTLTTSSGYPAQVQISDDAEDTCNMFANLHVFRFSENGSTPADFMNNDTFFFVADLVLDGPGHGEAGLQVAPWYSPNIDGRLNVRTTDGEVAAFGGELPFFSFTATYGLVYVKGTPINLKIQYDPNSNTELDPGTIEYKVNYNGVHYTSGPLPITSCNVPEQPVRGCYGIRNGAQAGGHLQALWFPGQNQLIRATWSDFKVLPFNKPTAAVSSSWGKVKTIYR